MRKHESFQRGSPKPAYMRVYIDFLLELATWTCFTEDSVNVASDSDDYILKPAIW